MGFSERELVNINSAALQANTFDSKPSAVWYEKILSFQFVLNANKVWTQVSSIPAASTLAQARTNASANPTIIQDLSQVASAIRLGEVPGTNKATWACYGLVGGNPTPGQPITDNWILPQQVQDSVGNPSFGYSITLYNGDPNAGGTVITTGSGQTGSGQEKSVAWVFNYATGALLLSSDFYSRTGINSNTFDPYITGFRYIGQTAGSGGGSSTTAERLIKSFTLGETVAEGDVVRVATSNDAPITSGRIVKALATTGDNVDAIGIAGASGNAGDSIDVVLSGTRNLTFGVAPTTSQIGKDIFLSPTSSGEITFTPPSATNQSVVKIGKLLFADGSGTSQPCKIDIEYIVGLL